MSNLKRIKIDAKEEFVLEIHHRNMKVSEVIVNVQTLDFSIGKADVQLNVLNPSPLTEETTVFTYKI